MEYFKGDATELKMVNSALPIMDSIAFSFDQFFASQYESVRLGEFLFDQDRMPLTNAVKREIFILCFKQIFEAWSFCGTFESYILVFRKIFGEDATIEFTVPGPGRLQVDVTTAGTQGYNATFRQIESNAYVSYDFVDYNGDNILFENPLGIDNQFELEKILFSMVPNGIFTEVSLSVGV